MYLGRVVEPDEPYWLPEDREVVDVWHYFEATRHHVCRKWAWEEDDMDAFVLDMEECPFCIEIEGRDQEVREKRRSMTGVSYYYRPLDLDDPNDRRVARTRKVISDAY